MSDDRASLVRQPALFSREEMATTYREACERSEAGHSFDLSRSDPDKIAQIAELLAQGMGQLRCAEITGSSVHTVRAVASRCAVAIQEERARLARNMRSASALLVEHVIDIVADPAQRAKLSARDATVSAGILDEHADRLEGGATSRVEHVIRTEPARLEQDYRDALELVETGKGAWGLAQKGPGPGALGAGSAAVEPGPEVDGELVEEGTRDA